MGPQARHLYIDVPSKYRPDIESSELSAHRVHSKRNSFVNKYHQNLVFGCRGKRISEVRCRTRSHILKIVWCDLDLCNSSYLLSS